MKRFPDVTSRPMRTVSQEQLDNVGTLQTPPRSSRRCTAVIAWLACIAAGGFLAWRWPWAVWPHLGAVSWGVALVVAGLDCPLTAAEDWSRQRAGEPPLTAGFVDRFSRA